MFESAELGHSIDKQTYKAEVPELREQLLTCASPLTLRDDVATDSDRDDQTSDRQNSSGPIHRLTLLFHESASSAFRGLG